MSKIRKMLMVATALLVCGTVQAADFSDPEWPCIQRRVDSLSIGLVWPLAIPDSASAEEIDPAARDLAATLALRRVSLSEAKTLIEEYVQANPGISTDTLSQIYRHVFEQINHQRTTLIKGISRYSLKQIELSKRIDATRAEMDQVMAQQDPDFDRVDALEEQLHWDERIFRDRAKSLTYVCETPVLMEKRVYAIAQDLLSFVPK